MSLNILAFVPLSSMLLSEDEIKFLSTLSTLLWTCLPKWMEITSFMTELSKQKHSRVIGRYMKNTVTLELFNV